MSADPTSFADDVDCSSFFDQVEDLLDFPEDSKNSSNPLVGAFPGFVGMGSGCSPDLAAELSIPYEDIVQMEWLSTFMEDSFSAGSNMTLDRRQFPVANEVAAAAAAAVAPIQFRSSSPISVLESSSSTSSTSSSSEGAKILPISPDNARVKGGCGRARSKRARPPAFNRGSAMQLISQGENFSNSSEQKKRRNTSKASCPPNPAAENVTSSDQSQAGVRKCLHCEITKTPQWRAGPLGPKTLCNACGVRYKSGRLFPEYRPAASPTFVPSLHSNSHKKVLEMRITTLDGPASDPHPDLIPNMDAMLGQD